MTHTVDQDIFSRFVPEQAVEYCQQLWKTFDFSLKISRGRNSKLGDYKYDPMKDLHFISVNNNLNHYSFLITYIHEVAHCVVRRKYRIYPKPHGREWKKEFRMLMLPVLNPQVFPDSVLGPLANHMRNPKATSTSDPKLLKALKEYDKNNRESILSDIEAGGEFLFNKKIYRKLEKRRTRSLCLQVATNKKYLISESAPVKKFVNS